MTMFSNIRRRVTPAAVIAALALVFATAGGAYAAKKYLITSTKQISPKVLKALAGKPGHAGPAGATGAAGPAGSAGAAGAKGENGAAGAKGENGAAGTNGTNGEQGVQGIQGIQGIQGATGSAGESVTVSAYKGTECHGENEEGAKLTNAKGTAYACNGAAGATGATGPTGPQGPLQPGKSESGQWTVSQYAAGEALEGIAVALSFNIPLSSPLAAADVHYIGELEGEGEPNANLPTGCSGNYKDPKAASGNLCVFLDDDIDFGSFKSFAIPFEVIDVETGGEPGAGVSGAVLSTSLLSGFKPAKGTIVGSGDWIVTG